MSDKRGWVLFGAKSAQSETPVRAAAKRRPSEEAEVGKTAQPSVERVRDGC